MVKTLHLVKIHEKPSLLETTKRPLTVVSGAALAASLCQQRLCEATHAARRTKCKTTARFAFQIQLLGFFPLFCPRVGGFLPTL